MEQHDLSEAEDGAAHAYVPSLQPLERSRLSPSVAKARTRLSAAAGSAVAARGPAQLCMPWQQATGMLSMQELQCLQQQQQQQQQQQNWDQQQQQQQLWEQQQQQCTQQQYAALGSALPGALCDAFACLQADSLGSQHQPGGGNDSGADWCKCQHIMHSSSSSPNLQLHSGLAGLQHCADGNHTSDRPMRSSSSCSSLSGLPGAGGLQPPAAAGGGGGGGKSRLGRLAAAAAVPGPPGPAPAAGSPGLDNGCTALPGQGPRQLPLQQSGPAAAPPGSISGAGDCSANWMLERAGSSCSMQSEGLGRRLRIHTATFNMGSKLPQSVPLSLLGLHTPEPPDLIAIATQESGNIVEWERLLSASLAPAGYDKLAWQSLRAIHLVLFAGQRCKRQVVAVRGSAVATGIGNLVGNKGGVALAVQLADLKLLFVGAHFAAHADKVERRNADFARIKAGLFSGSGSTSPSPSSSSADITGGSSANSPLIGGTLQQAVAFDAPACAGECGGSSGGGGRRGAVAFARDCNSSGGSCAAGARPGGPLRPASPGGWLGALDSPTSTAGRGSAGSLSPCRSDDSETSCICSPHGSMPAQLAKQLRAASYPDNNRASGAGQAALQPEVSACSSTSSASGCNSPLLQGAGSAPASADSTGSATGGSLSIAEEVRSQLSFFKSFVVRRPSVGLFSGRGVAGGCDVTAGQDVVIWAGDLNYRINGNSRAVAYLMRSRLHEVLHANDQLRLQQKKGHVFQGFKEGRIHFPPTFKFLPGSSDYSEQRVPSWTDRILWKVRSPEEATVWPGDDEAAATAPSVALAYYTSVPEVTSSDHKPVVAGFEVALAGCELPMLAEAAPARQRCSIM